MKRFVYLSVFLVFSFRGLMAQLPEQKMSLQQAVDYALVHSNEVQTAAINRDLREEIVNEVYAVGLPKVSAGFDYQNFFQQPTSLIPAEFFGGKPGEFAEITFGTKQNATLKFTASQLLFDGRFFVGLRATKEVLALADLEEQYSKVPVKEKVVKGYYTAILSQQSLRELNETLLVLKKMQTETEAYYKEGFAQQLDVDRLKLSVSNLQTQIDNLNNNSLLALSALKYMIGMPQDQQLILTDSLEMFSKQLSLSDMPVAMPENRLEYKLIEKNITLQNFNVRQNKAAYLPTVVAFASLSTQAQRNKFNFFNDGHWYPTGLWGVSLSIPIFDGMQTATKVRTAKLNLQLAENSKENFESGQLLQLHSAYTSYTNALATVESNKESLTLAKDIHDKAYIMYKEGVGSSLEISSSETALIQSQMNYIQALYSLLMAKADLDLAQGNL